MAAVIYDNGAPGLQPPTGPEITVREMAAPFTISTPALVTGFEFWSFELTRPFIGYAGSISWAIYSDLGAPGRVIESGQARDFRREAARPGSVLGSSALVYKNTIDIDAVLLNAGTYWLGLKNGAPSPDALDNFNGFFWAATSQGLSDSFTQVPDGWDPSGLALSYSIQGTPPAVPEPSTALLLAPAAAWVIIRRRRAQRG